MGRRLISPLWAGSRPDRPIPDNSARLSWGVWSHRDRSFRLEWEATVSTPQEPGFAGVAELPPYRSMLVVDMKDYSGNPGRYQTDLTKLIPKIMKAAFRRGGLASIWERRSFHNTTGDGYAIGLPAELLPFLLNPYLGLLQAELEDRNRSRPREIRDPIRLRVSVNVGPISDTGTNRVGDGSGAARVELHRLLDSKPVRQLLAGSDSEVTYVAGILSERVYQDAVLSGYADEPGSIYVPAPVQEKSYSARAYLRIPKPSGELLTRGFGAPGESPAKSAARPAEDVARVQINDHTALRVGGVGNIGGGVGTILNDPSGPVNTGSGGQYVTSSEIDPGR